MIIATYSYMWGAYVRSEKDKPIHKMINKVNQLTDKDIKAQVTDFFATQDHDLVDPVAQLKKAPLEDKRIYLRAVPIISAPVAAAYLGVTTAAVNKFTANHYHAIGDRYARGYCLSMDEVFLIEQNPQWLAGVQSQNDAGGVDAVEDGVFDCLLFLSEDVACAFTDMKPSELHKAAKAGVQALRPFRLSDLEKIRVAKLSAAAATSAKHGLLPTSTDAQILIDWEMANGYTVSSMKESTKVVPQSMPPVWPLYLSDLEKIRVAKLNGQQQ